MGTTVSNIGELNAAIVAADSATAPGTLTIDFAAGTSISLSGDYLEAINLHAGVTLDINGFSDTLDGGGNERGLFVYAGSVNISDLNIDDMTAHGGNAYSHGGGGGGGGLGGGLFVGANDTSDPGSVTLTDVSFSGDAAVGGKGGNEGERVSSGGGGGGLGGGGGVGDSGGAVVSGGGGGGGGIGSDSGDGGGGALVAASGIVPGATGGGAGVNGGAGGPSGGGGGGGGFSARGPGGGGGAGGVDGSGKTGGAGGYGGGGGGGGGGAQSDRGPGGAGGFGGGGGDGDANGGTGGFGGGGGGGGSLGAGGAGGFGGGNGGQSDSGGGGGGGLGAGGDIFVQHGASLTIAGLSNIGVGSVAGGTAGTSEAGNSVAGAGQQFGTGIYLQGNNTLTFAPVGTETVAGVIADDYGAAQAASYGSPATYTAGIVGVAVHGSGTLLFTAANQYSFDTTVYGGATLELASGATAGTNAIALPNAGSVLRLDAPVSGSETFGNQLFGLAIDAQIDLAGLAFVAGATATYANGTLTVAGGANSEQFVVGAIPGGSAFYVSQDAGTGSLVSLLTPVQELNAQIAAADSVTAPGTVTITLTQNVNLGTTPLTAINLAAGVVLDIVGNNVTLDGADTERGLFVYAGSVEIGNLALNNMVALGGTGESGGGGGAGLGGGLFIGANDTSDPGSVTLSNVTFGADAALGGNGTVGGVGTGLSAGSGGGGGLGGNGGNGKGAASGGGGGIGAGTVGAGGNPAAPGANGILPGVTAGGAGVGGAGGLSGGGGGGGNASRDGAGGGGVHGGAGGSSHGGGGGYGGGGGASSIGGGGGFGGGGGYGIHSGGAGGFGGGGGGAGGGVVTPVPGAGGFGGGGAGVFQGGGGLGAGGDVFVQQGASLTIAGSSDLGLGSVGAGNNGLGSAGQAFATGIYLQGDNKLTFEPSAGATLTVAGAIGDDTDSALAASYTGPAGYTPGSVSVSDAGTGTLLFTAANSYSGGTVIVHNSRLEIAAGASAGSGSIDLNGAAAYLQLDAPVTGSETFANTLSQFRPGTTLDLRGFQFAAGETATIAGGTLTVQAGGTSEQFTLADDPDTHFVGVATDGMGGSLVTPETAAQYLSNEIRAADGVTAPGTVTIALTQNITLGDTPLLAINVAAGVTLDIVGNGFALDGSGSERGLFVYAGAVAVSDLTLKNMTALGGYGSGGGGGGAGLGGGLFVGANDTSDPGSVTLTNVMFSGDQAVGGGSAAGAGFGAADGTGGGGGLGGNGGKGGSGTGGGGGIGAGTVGAGGVGGTPAGNGAKGLVPGATSGGSATRGGGGGSSGGGGGGNAGTRGGGGGGVGGGQGHTGGGGAGGYGGGGGGGAPGGKGGFGGGGGFGYGVGGAGGFGGGGGGTDNGAGTSSAAGIAGFGGGAGAGGVGGGGLGAGGDVFVQQGGTITIAGTSSLGAGVATGGTSDGGGSGESFGNGIYAQGNTTLSFATSAGQTVSITGQIADDSGAAGAASYMGAAGYTPGQAGLLVTGAGTLLLDAANQYTGGTTLDAGTRLEIVSGASAGSGAIDFANAPATLQLDAPVTTAVTFANTLDNFGAGDTLDLVGFTFAVGETATASGGTLTVANGATSEQFAISNTADVTFSVTSDGGDNSLVTLQTPLQFLNSEIVAADGVTAPGTVTIALNQNIAPDGTALEAINLHPGVTLDFVGNGFYLDGGGSERGLFVYAGTVDISDLRLNDMQARGGSGGLGGGGGGAGLGGGLFIGANDTADPGRVTLNNVMFSGDSAVGGNGAAGGNLNGNGTGGGGGLGGNGGRGGTGGTGGGGGIGAGAAGAGGGGKLPGAAGLVPGANRGGGGANGGAGGTSGGGGGGGGGNSIAGQGAGGGGVGGHGGNAGDGGTGGYGGGGGGGTHGGGGGFGGGGGDGYVTGGSGGFGGGGGGGNRGSGNSPIDPGHGGYGGGDGGSRGGGGGLGAGGDVFVQEGASLTIDGSSDIGAGSAAGGNGGTGGIGGEGFADGIYAQGDNTLDFMPTGTETVEGAIGDDAGSALSDSYHGPASYTPGHVGIIVSGSGTLILSADDSYSGATTIMGGATLGLAKADGAGTGAIDIAAGSTLRVPGHIANTITGFEATLDDTGLTFSDAKIGASLTDGVLTITGNGTSDTFDIGPGVSLLSDTPTNDGSNGLEVVLMCFLAGTHILTPSGERRVETLRPGDLVTTAFGEQRKLRWIGCGRTLVTPRNRDRASPVVVRRGALADNVPHRDLYITNNHSLYFGGVFVPAKDLINHRSILWDEAARVIEYYHLELDSHDVVIAEGAAAETYWDDDDSPQFLNFASRPAAPPKLPVAPVLTDEHPLLRRIWAELAERAGRLDPTLMLGADLHLLADGVRLDPESIERGLWRFRLAGPVADLRIVSRSAVPSVIGSAWDHRRLGVGLRRIVLAQPGIRRTLQWDDVRLVVGFHAPEPAGRQRWTDGSARLPAASLLRLRAGATVELLVTSQLRYYEMAASAPRQRRAG